MKRILFALVILFSIISIQTVSATPLKPTLKLLGIKAVVTGEHKGDELYMIITMYPSHGKPSHFYVPRQPLYWPTEHIEKVKMLNIWRGELKNNEAVTLLISLMDRDAPPWSTDDLIGVIKLIVVII